MAQVLTSVRSRHRAFRTSSRVMRSTRAWIASSAEPMTCACTATWSRTTSSIALRGARFSRCCRRIRSAATFAQVVSITPASVPARSARIRQVSGPVSRRPHHGSMDDVRGDAALPPCGGVADRADRVTGARAIDLAASATCGDGDGSSAACSRRFGGCATLGGERGGADS